MTDERLNEIRSELKHTNDPEQVEFWGVDELVTYVDQLRAELDDARQIRLAIKLHRAQEELAAAQTRIEKLEGALKSLANEAQGFVSQANPADHGHTNISVMNHWIEVAREALKP